MPHQACISGWHRQFMSARCSVHPTLWQSSMAKQNITRLWMSFPMIEYERSMYREIPGYIHMFDSREREFVIASKKNIQYLILGPGLYLTGRPRCRDGKRIGGITLQLLTMALQMKQKGMMSKLGTWIIMIIQLFLLWIFTFT